MNTPNFQMTELALRRAAMARVWPRDAVGVLDTLLSATLGAGRAWVFARQDTLAAAAGLSKSEASRGLNWLVSMGVLARRKEREGGAEWEIEADTGRWHAELRGAGRDAQGAHRAMAVLLRKADVQAALMPEPATLERLLDANEQFRKPEPAVPKTGTALVRLESVQVKSKSGFELGHLKDLKGEDEQAVMARWRAVLGAGDYANDGGKWRNRWREVRRGEGGGLEPVKGARTGSLRVLVELEDQRRREFRPRTSWAQHAEDLWERIGRICCGNDQAHT